MKDFIPILVCGLLALIFIITLALCISGSIESRYDNALKYAVEDQVISTEQYNKLQIYFKWQGIKVEEWK